MEKVLIIGLNNTISKALIDQRTDYPEYNFFFTSSRKSLDFSSLNIFYLNFLDDSVDNDSIENIEFLASFSKVVFISSYYGSTNEKIDLVDTVIANNFITNVQKFVFRYANSRKENARIIFIGSIVIDEYIKSRYPLYKLFKLNIKSICSLINTYYNKDFISAVYVNLGSFRNEVKINDATRIRTQEVVELINYLLMLPLNVKVDVVNFKPLLE